MRSRILFSTLVLFSLPASATAQQAPQQAPQAPSSSTPGESKPAQPAGAAPLPAIEVVTTAKKGKAKTGKKKVSTVAQKAPAAQPQQPAPEPVANVPPPPGSLIAPQTTLDPTTKTGAAEIQANGGATLTDTLQNKPGIAGSTFAPGANRPIIRGLDNNRVRVQENGVTTGDVSDISEDHAIPVDPSTADDVTVIRGPATLRYGSTAIGGVVSTENQRIPTFIPEHGFAGEIRGGLSSVDDGRDGSFKATAGASGFAVHADGFARNSEDYDTPQGVQKNSFVDSSGASMGASYLWTSGFFGVSFTHFDSLYAIPGIESAEAKSRIDMAQDKINGRGEWRATDLGLAAIRTWMGWTDYAHNELDFDAAEGHDTIGSRFTNKQAEGRFELETLPVATVAGALRTTVGLQLGSRDLVGRSFEGDSLLEPNTTDTIGAYIFEELQLAKPLRIQAAARVEHDNVNGATFEDIATPDVLLPRDLSFEPASGSLGVLYDFPAGVIGRLSGSYAERAPTAQELFSKGAHDATGTFEIGDPNIGIEAAKTIELGFNRAKGAFRFDTSLYYTSFDGYIFRQLTGETCDATIASCGPGGGGGDLKQVIFSQRDATFYGTEIASELDVGPIWRGIWGVSAQYDFVHAEFSNGENVPRMPPHRLGSGVFYRDGSWQARLSVLHAFRQDEIASHETPTEGYTLLNAELSTKMVLSQVGALSPSFLIGLKGENLLNDDVRNSASFKKDEVLLPGANVRLFGTLSF